MTDPGHPAPADGGLHTEHRGPVAPPPGVRALTAGATSPLAWGTAPPPPRPTALTGGPSARAAWCMPSPQAPASGIGHLVGVIRTLAQATAWVDEVGLALLFPKADVVLPSLWEQVNGSPDRDWAVRDGEGGFVRWT